MVSEKFAQYGKERDFWLKKFSGNLTKSLFPYDFKETLSSRGRTNLNPVKSRITGELCSRLTQLSSGYDSLLHVILTAGLVVLLNRYTGSSDIIVGMPIYKQEAEGDFINTVLALRTRLEEEKTFKELLKQVRQNIGEAAENQNYPIRTLLYQLNLPFIEEDSPLFDVVILLENIHKKEYIQHFKHNIAFNFLKKEDSIEAVVEYNSLLYNKDTIEQINRHFIHLLDKAVSHLDSTISRIEILSEQDKKHLLVEFNNTRTTYPADKTIDHLFEEQVDLGADKLALVYESKSLSYKELDQRADRLAAFLSTKGVTLETAVGIMAEHSIEVIIGILAVLKVGASYLPIDFAYPEERKRYIVDDCNIKILLTTYKTDGIYNCDVIYLEDARIFSLEPSIKKSHRYNNLAYIMYTSGSTGKPKGVMIEHRNVVRLVKNTNFIKFKKEDRILQTGALEFDASTFEIWGTLLNGLRLYLVSKDNVLSLAYLKDRIRKYKITTMWLTSPLFKQLLDTDKEMFHGLWNLVVGGDVLSPVHINRLRDRYPRLNVINGYGPTENTTFSTTFLVDREFKDNIPIGKPIANSTAYIFDKHERLAPQGVPGELYVGGDGVSRGYLNSPGLTEEKFVVNESVPDDRLYRTGDLVRRLPGGDFEFIGRIDHQVKIRGYRVEPGEIENHLMKIDSIKEALVVARTDRDGEVFLCSYVISPQTVDWTGIRKILSRTLPDYMIPAHFVQMESFPLTPNKKIDIKALPEPALDRGTDYTPPGDIVEEKLTRIWAEILKIEKERIGIDADFFDLGGHSLKATILITRVHKEFNVNLPLAEIFHTPTIRGLSEYIRGKTRDEFKDIPLAGKKEYYALSSAQKRLYILQQMNPTATNYNIPIAVTVQGKLHRGKLEAAFKKLMNRHESLRTSFMLVEHQPCQQIQADAEFAIEYYDKKGDEEIIKNFVRPFDLSKGPLLRVGLIKEEEEKHILILDIHHIITDGTSMVILIRELMQLYNGEELPPLRIQYKDFSEWQNSLLASGQVKRQEEYWLKEFAGEISVLDLPLDYERPAKRSVEGSVVSFMLDSEETAVLKRLALDEEVTLYMVLLVLYNILLSKISRQQDIVIGTSIASRRHADLEPVIGMFVNTLALRNRPSGEKTFKEFLKEVGERTLEAFKNQDYPFEDLVEKAAPYRDASRNPLFDVRFSFHNEASTDDIAEIELPGLKLVPYKTENQTSKSDITLQGIEIGDKLLFTFEYCTKLFKRATIERLVKYFKEIMGYVKENRDIKIKEMGITHELVAIETDVSEIDLEF